MCLIPLFETGYEPQRPLSSLLIAEKNRQYMLRIYLKIAVDGMIYLVTIPCKEFKLG